MASARARSLTIAGSEARRRYAKTGARRPGDARGVCRDVRPDKRFSSSTDKSVFSGNLVPSSGTLAAVGHWFRARRRWRRRRCPAPGAAAAVARVDTRVGWASGSRRTRTAATSPSARRRVSACGASARSSAPCWAWWRSSREGRRRPRARRTTHSARDFGANLSASATTPPVAWTVARCRGRTWKPPWSAASSASATAHQTPNLARGGRSRTDARAVWAGCRDETALVTVIDTVTDHPCGPC